MKEMREGSRRKRMKRQSLKGKISVKDLSKNEREIDR